MSLEVDKPFEPSFKFKVAFEALKGHKTMVELCQEFGVMEDQILAWKTQLAEAGALLFRDKRKKENRDEAAHLKRVIEKITSEKDFLKRVLKK